MADLHQTQARDRLDHLSSRELLVRLRQGERSALDVLFERHIPAVTRWARGRLPRWARGLLDTGDLVQEAVLQTFRRLDRFEPRGRGALQAYLREAVQNRIRDELRRISRRPQSELDEFDRPDDSPSPLQLAIDGDNTRRYRLALRALKEDDRSLIVARLELGYNYDQLALLTGRRTPDAARVALRRALLHLAEAMERE